MNATEEILDLLETNGQSGSDMTQALKAIGGDMKTGIKKIGEYFFDEGMSKGYQAGVTVGEKSGLLKGSAIALGLVALVQGGVYLYEKHKEKKTLTVKENARREEASVIKEAIRTASADLTGTQSGENEADVPNALEVNT